MGQSNIHNVTKSANKTAQFSSVRLTSATKKRLSTILRGVNKKGFGKRVKASQVIELSLSLLSDHHIKQLQEKSISNADILEMRFREYSKKHGKISKDDFLGILLNQQSHG